MIGLACKDLGPGERLDVGGKTGFQLVSRYRDQAVSDLEESEAYLAGREPAKRQEVQVAADQRGIRGETAQHGEAADQRDGLIAQLPVPDLVADLPAEIGVGLLVEQDLVLEAKPILGRLDPAADWLVKQVLVEVDPHDEQLPALERTGQPGTPQPALDRAG